VKRYYIGSLILIALFGGYPFASMLVASFVANAAGCGLDEGQAHACIIHGHDYGPRLYEMAVSVWLMIFTLPLAELAFLIWIVVLAIDLTRQHLRWRRQRVRAE
jgi:hypothetical protein